MRHTIITTVALAAAALAWPGAAVAGTHHAATADGTATYDETLMGTLGGASSFARGLNNLGLVVGDATTSTGATHAFRASADHIVDLGTLPGGVTSTALDINDAGDAVGVSGDSAGFEQAVIWGSDAVPRALATPANSSTHGRHINNRGDVIGDVYSFDTGTDEGALWLADGRLIRLGDFFPNGLNDAGELVGTISGAGGARAALWRDGEIIDLTTRGLTEPSVAFGINDRGQIIGVEQEDGGPFRAFVLTGSQVSFIGPPGVSSMAIDINNAGAALATVSGRPVLWTRGTTVSLDARGLDHAIFVVAVNDRGQLAGEDLRAEAALFTPQA